MRRRILCLFIILSIVLFSGGNINAIPYIWPLGPPTTMNWHDNLLAIGAETGYVVVLNVNGNFGRFLRMVKLINFGIIIIN